MIRCRCLVILLHLQFLSFEIHPFILQWRRSLILGLRKTPFMDMTPVQWTGKLWDMVFFGHSCCSHQRRLLASVRSSHRRHISFSFHVDPRVDHDDVPRQQPPCVDFLFLASTTFTHTRSLLFGRAVSKDSFCNMGVQLCVTPKGKTPLGSLPDLSLSSNSNCASEISLS